MAGSPTALAYDRPLTYDDLLAMPDDGLRREIIDGELIVTPAPSSGHQRVLFEMARLLDDHLRQTGSGELFVAPFDVRLGRFDVVEPDIVVLRSSHPRVPDHENGIDYPPDLVVEILSPSSRGIDRVRKMALYARAGVAEYWIADPVQRVLTVHHLRGDEYITAAPDADGVIESRVLPGLRVDPRLVFARLV